MYNLYLYNLPAFKITVGIFILLFFWAIHYYNIKSHKNRFDKKARRKIRELVTSINISKEEAEYYIDYLLSGGETYYAFRCNYKNFFEYRKRNRVINFELQKMIQNIKYHKENQTTVGRYLHPITTTVMESKKNKQTRKKTFPLKKIKYNGKSIDVQKYVAKTELDILTNKSALLFRKLMSFSKSEKQENNDKRTKSYQQWLSAYNAVVAFEQRNKIKIKTENEPEHINTKKIVKKNGLEQLEEIIIKFPETARFINLKKMYAELNSPKILGFIRDVKEHNAVIEKIYRKINSEEKLESFIEYLIKDNNIEKAIEILNRNDQKFSEKIKEKMRGKIMVKDIPIKKEAVLKKVG